MSECGEGSEETSLAGAEWDSAAAGGSVTGGGGGHPVGDKGAGAEDARVALPRNQGSLPPRLRSPLMGRWAKQESPTNTCSDCRRQGGRGTASPSDNIPPLSIL